MFDAASAMGNSGLYAGTLPAVNAWQTQLILLPLALLGGLGSPVLIELFDRARGRGPLSTHSQRVLRWTAGIYVVAVAVLLFLQWPDSTEAWRRSIASASQLAISARSAGFPFEFPTIRAVQWFVLALMIVGAAPAGTAGGLKVTTLAVVTSGACDALRRRPVGRALGVALVWVGVYFVILAVAVLVLVTTEPQIPADRMLFLAASALGNVGLSQDPVTLSDVGFYIVSAVMLVGRVAPVLMLWWVVDTTPEAEVAVG
jgi:Trk-type K+ transport system membrane component